MSRFIGITREPVFSPGRVDDDAAILGLVADHLRRMGHTVSVCGADVGSWPEPGPDTVVFTMCQGATALQRLQRWAARGVRVINSPEGILNCQRHRTIAALASADIPFPASAVVDTHAEPLWPAWVITGHAWVKRGDVHATEADDVVAIHGVDEARAALQRFRARGIAQAVLQQHAAGTVLKFYAVRGRFFHCGTPRVGGEIPGHVLSRIDAIGQQAARALTLEVYGGDCVVSVNGVLTLIDLNDWPSYAPCRTEAAAAIAAYVCTVKAKT
jgi:hypothetical protein